jgi:hypothetical protein
MQWTGKDVKGSLRGIIWGTIPIFVLEDSGKSRKISVTVLSFRNAVRSWRAKQPTGESGANWTTGIVLGQASMRVQMNGHKERSVRYLKQ